MKPKGILIATSVAAFAVAAFFLLMRKDAGRAGLSGENSRDGESSRVENSNLAIMKAAKDPQVHQVNLISKSAGKIDINSPKDAAFKIVKKSGEKPVVVNSKGEVVYSNYPYNTISACSANPGGNMILLYFGNSDYEIVELLSEIITILPKRPSGGNKIDFSDWRWAGDDLLVGQSGMELEERQEVAGEDSIKIQSEIYIFSMNSKTLEKIQLPGEVDAKMFSVTKVSNKGDVFLENQDPNFLGERKIGWFKINMR